MRARAPGRHWTDRERHGVVGFRMSYSGALLRLGCLALREVFHRADLRAPAASA